jgi:hypothetical protein
MLIMNFVTYAIVLAAALLGCLAAVGVRAEEAPSTYNFYFQKAPGPVTVNQGGAPAAPNAPVPAAAPQNQAQPVPTAAVTSVAPEESASQKKLFLTLGYAMLAPFSPPSRYENLSMQKNEYVIGGQFAIKGEYELSERIALTGEVYKLKKEVGLFRAQPYFHKDRSVGAWYDLPAGKKRVEKNVLDFSLGAAYNLVRLRSTTFSLLGGVITAPYIRYESISSDANGGHAVPTSVDHERNIFLGARLRLIADNVWGLDLSYRALLSAEVGIAQLGLTFAI